MGLIKPEIGGVKIIISFYLFKVGFQALRRIILPLKWLSLILIIPHSNFSPISTQFIPKGDYYV
jgi:hypothetical protein